MNHRRRYVNLNDDQRRELIELRNKASIPYLRERAAAILKIANGQSATQVARESLLKTRKHETVLSWLNRYQESGIQGLYIKPGRGRKAAFSPCV